MQDYQEGTGTEEELLRVKEYYFRKKYILRLFDKIGQLRNIASLRHARMAELVDASDSQSGNEVQVRSLFLAKSPG